MTSVSMLSRPHDNRVLAALPPAEMARLLPCLEPVTWALPQKFSNMRAHYSPDLLGNHILSGSAVDEVKAFRLFGGEREIGVADVFVECRALLLHAIGAVPTSIAHLRPGQAGG